MSNYMNTRFDSCSIAELEYCRKSRVETICEIRRAKQTKVLADYPHLASSLTLNLVIQRNDIKTIDGLIKRLTISGCHNNRIYKEKHHD